MKPFIKELEIKFNLLNEIIDNYKGGEFYSRRQHDKLIKSKHDALDQLQELINSEKQRNY